MQNEQLKDEMLTEKEIVEFYNKVLVLFEQKIKNPQMEKDYVCRHKHVPIPIISVDATNELIENFRVKFEYEIAGDFKENTVEFSKNVRPHSYYMLFKFLRHSFAHMGIKKEDEYFLFENYEDNGTLTMRAKIKQSIFFDYIETIYAESIKFKEKREQRMI